MFQGICKGLLEALINAILQGVEDCGQEASALRAKNTTEGQ